MSHTFQYREKNFARRHDHADAIRRALNGAIDN
jgi:hypothetical protein